MRDTPERDDDAQRMHGAQFPGEEGSTRRDLSSGRAIFGRNAADGIGNAASDQAEGIVGARLVATLRESECQESLVKKVTGIVTRERAAGPVGTLESGRETDDQQPAASVAETRDGSVVELRKRGPVGVTELGEPRTSATVWRRLWRSGR